MADSTTTTQTADTQAKAWFDADGWQLPPDELRAYLTEHEASTDLIVELLDEAADRKRAHAAAEAKRRQASNGHPPAPVPSPAPAHGQIPPQNLEAEESVLGAMMISPKAIDKVRDVLGDDGRDFYRDSHAMIYRAALSLHDQGEPVDAITLTAELERRGELDRVGGRVRLHELSLLVPASANVAHYAGIVRETATFRGLIRAGGEIAQLGWERAGDPAHLVDRAEDLVFQLAERNRAHSDEPSPWTPTNLADLPEKPPIVPDLGETGLIYPSKRHVFSGAPESAKTLAAYAILIQIARGAEIGILIDFEMGAYDARQRLRELGATDDELARILYLEPDERATTAGIAALAALNPALVVIDAAAGAYQLEGLDDNRRLEVETFSKLYVHGFWRAGIATILIDHVVKDADQRGRFTIGSERKLGGADVHIGFDTVKAISRGSTGRYKLIVHKDRGGYHKRGHLADLQLDSDPDTHQIDWQFTDPEATTGQNGYFRPTHLMEKVSVHLELRHEPATRNDVYTAIGGTKEYVLKAITALALEGYIAETAGPNRSKLLTSERPFRESDEPASTPGGSVVRQWFGSGSRTTAPSGGSVVRPPTGAEPPDHPSPNHPKHDGWFDQDGDLRDTYLDSIAPDPEEEE